MAKKKTGSLEEASTVEPVDLKKEILEIMDESLMVEAFDAATLDYLLKERDIECAADEMVKVVGELLRSGEVKLIHTVLSPDVPAFAIIKTPDKKEKEKK